MRATTPSCRTGRPFRNWYRGRLRRSRRSAPRKRLPARGGSGMRSNRFRALWRMRSFLRPYRGQVLVMFACAALSVGASIVIPLIAKAIVNGPIRHGDRGTLVPMALVALLLGVFEAVLIFGRRWVQSVAILNVEAKIRDDLYSHLQRLSVAFHDRWQTGQLLSRATTDLSTIRRFFGFGAIYLVVNALQVTTVLILLLTLYWPLGVVVAVTMTPVAWLGKRFGNVYGDISRRMQDQQGDLATLVEEAATGIRVVKAFGRGPLMQARFGRSARTLQGTRPA